jgi:hypothetical protein
MRRARVHPSRDQRATPRAGRRRGAGALLVMLVLVSGLAVVLAGFLAPAGVARADSVPDNNANPYFTLAMAQSTQNLVDGQAMPFTVSRTPAGDAAGLEIAAVGTGWCASDVQLPVDESAGNQVFNTFTTGFPVVNSTTPGAPPDNCLDYVNSDLSAVVANGSALPTIAPQPNTDLNVAGKPGDYPTVTGEALAEVGQGGEQPIPFNGLSVNCLPSVPCTFAVAVWTKNVITPGQNNIYFLGVPTTFLDASASLACNGPASGQVASESPDRLGETLTQLGIDACKSGVGGGDSLTFNLGSGNSDDEALCAFAGDTVDLAYSAVGYGASGSDFSPTNCQGGAAPARAYVAVPIGLNAVVLAHAANEMQATPYLGYGTTLVHYGQQLEIGIGQLAQLLSNAGLEDASGYGQLSSDSGSWSSELGTGLLQLNPELADGYQSAHPGQSVTGVGSGGVALTSGTDATTYLTTSFLNALAPAQLTSAPDPNAGLPSEHLGVTSNFGRPPPAYSGQTYTGRSILTHYLTPISGSAWWALTDSATAAATWNTASMQAAADNMTAQPDGTLLPNPNGGAVDGVEPYPLTYVEYAIAPTQPLLNPDCTRNTAEQASMNQWLTFLVNQGQKDLPPGMAPLPSALDAQATADIAKVGAAAPACTPTTTTDSNPPASATPEGSTPSATSSTTPPGSNSATPFSLGSSGFPSTGFANESTGGSTSSATSSSKTATASPTPLSQAAALSLAAFGTVSANSWALPLLGVLVLTVLLPALALWCSGRSLRQVLGGPRPAADAAATGAPPPEGPTDP